MSGEDAARAALAEAINKARMEWRSGGDGDFDTWLADAALEFFMAFVPLAFTSAAASEGGQESVEWGVRWADGTVKGHTREMCESALVTYPGTLVRRTRIAYPDRVTEWAEVAPGGETE